MLAHKNFRVWVKHFVVVLGGKEYQFVTTNRRRYNLFIIFVYPHCLLIQRNFIYTFSKKYYTSYFKYVRCYLGSPETFLFTTYFVILDQVEYAR